MDIFCSFPCLVALIQFCTTVLNKNGKSGHPYLITDLRERLPLFHHSCVGFADAFFTHEEVPFIPNLFSIFTMKAYWIFFKCFFCVYWYDRMTFIFILLICVVVQSLSCVPLFVTPCIGTHQAFLSLTISRVCSNSCPLSQWHYPTVSFSFAPFPPALNLSQHQGLFQWVSSSHQVAKVLELQLQHQFY